MQLPLFPFMINLLFCCLVFNACDVENSEKTVSEKNFVQQNEAAFISTMEKHLNAVSVKDLKLLKSTMSPEGKMQLILPASEIIESVDSFMLFHEEWFKDTT